jgi:cyclopropane-fatty-acyl-phospholipid synthase
VRRSCRLARLLSPPPTLPRASPTGAWCGYGFHEDGIASAVRAVEALCGGGPVVPWEPFSCDAKVGLVPRACLSLFLRFGDAMLSRGGAIRLILPTGADCWLGDRAAPAEQTAVVRVRRASLFQKVVCKSDIGLGEAYMDGDYAGDVFKLLLLLSRSNSGSPSQLRQATAGALGWAGGALHSLFERLERDAHYANSNTEEGSARNISYHYDAGNDFYKLILDETMLCAAAPIPPPAPAPPRRLPPRPSPPPGTRPPSSRPSAPPRWRPSTRPARRPASRRRSTRRSTR